MSAEEQYRMAADSADRIDRKLDALAETVAAIRADQATFIEQTRVLADRAMEDRAAVRLLATKVDQLDRDAVKRVELEEASRRLYVRLGAHVAAVTLALQGLALWISAR